MNKSKTFTNVETAFHDECTAIIRYLIYADIAENEGDLESAELFRKMSRNETEHAKLWCRQLEDFSGNTLTNLKHSAGNENDEWKETYPQNAQTAKDEGCPEIATLFERIASIECDHERKFLEQAMSIENGEDISVKKVKNYLKHCIFCGYSTDEDLTICPVCSGVDCF